MKHLISKLTIALVLTSAGAAGAAVSPEEAKQLGTTLTPIGAEKAGNKDGTIPEYTGGLTTPPPTFKKGSGIRPDPFADEKPLFSITAQNVDQYGDKVTPGMRELLKRRPTYRMDVYPTHRTAAFPKYVLDNTIANATRAKTGPHGEFLEGAVGGYPFPIPKTGYEAMWDHILRWVGQSRTNHQSIWFVDSNGTATLTSFVEVINQYPYYEPGRKSIDTDDSYWFMQVTYTAPARNVGRATLFTENLRLDRKAWLYDPGQRRVRLTPDSSYDTPIATVGGIEVYDDQDLYTGKMDRFDFQLVGKREVFIPYNNYKEAYQCKAVDLLKTAKQHHINPDCERWELHRVWMIEAKLKPGKRHAYQRRVFYFDEDTWASGLSESYDASGKLYKLGVGSQAPAYDVPAASQEQLHWYDMSNNSMGVWSMSEDANGNTGRGTVYHPPVHSRELTPEALQGRGVR